MASRGWSAIVRRLQTTPCIRGTSPLGGANYSAAKEIGSKVYRRSFMTSLFRHGKAIIHLRKSENDKYRRLPNLTVKTYDVGCKIRVK